MKENKVLRISTAVDAKGAEQGLEQFAEMVKSTAATTVSIITAMSQKVKGLWGISLLDSAKAGQRAAAGQKALGKATAAAGKEAKGALAVFDELNVLQTEAAKGGSGGGSGTKPSKPDKPKPMPGADDMGALQAALEGLYAALEPLKDTLFAGLKWGYDNVLLPLATWVQNEALPAFLQAVAAGAELLNTALAVLQPAGSWLWESFLKPLAGWSGGLVIAGLDAIAATLAAVSGWIEDNKEKLLGLWTAVEPLFTVIAATVTGLFDGIKAYFDLWCGAFTESLTGMLDIWLGLLTGDWELAWAGIQTVFEANKELLLAGLGLLWEGMKGGFRSVFEAVKAIWTPISGWFAQSVAAPLQKSFGDTWSAIATAGDICLQTIKAIWQPFATWIYENALAPGLDMIHALWDDMISSFQLGFAALTGAAKDYINFQLDLVEGGSNVIVQMLNSIIGALNTIQVDIPEWVPKYGGNSFGVNIPAVPPIKLPRLATGAVIPPGAQFAAILGDQRNGRNLEAPEGLIREIVREESGSRDIVIRFEGSMAGLVQLLKPELERETQRQGARLVLGGL